jgi:hypothetical protein
MSQAVAERQLRRMIYRSGPWLHRAAKAVPSAAEGSFEVVLGPAWALLI